jgi:RES domain-containing protein
VTVVAWRIVQRRFAKDAFTGEGARRFGGRWNSPGHAVIYTAQSLALAVLEILVHVDSETLLQNYVAIPATIDEHLIVSIQESRLPNNWRAYPTARATQAIGDEWLAQGDSLVLRVPSAVIPEESNFLINPSHKDCPRRFKRAAVSPVWPASVDVKFQG